MEIIAWEYVNLSEVNISAITYGLVILGAIVAGVTSRSKCELGRVPYFAFSTLLLLADALSKFVWLGFVGAVNHGYLWVLMIVNLLASLIVGYFSGLIAMARSRDAFSNGRNAALAFIPLANLVLFLKPSKNAISARRVPPIPIVSGGIGVSVGAVTFITAIILLNFVGSELGRMAQTVERDPALQSIGMDYTIRSHGLKATLAQMAIRVRVPHKINESTTLEKVEAGNTTLSYHYTVNSGLTHIPDSVQQKFIRELCKSGVWRPILEAGGSAEHLYFGASNQAIGTVKITQSSCIERM